VSTATAKPIVVVTRPPLPPDVDQRVPGSVKIVAT
jgi:hypothetical protein